MSNEIEAIAHELNTNWEQADKVGDFERLDAWAMNWLNGGETEVWTDGREMIVLDYDAASKEWSGEVAGVEFYTDLAADWLKRYENSRTIADGFVAWTFSDRPEALKGLTSNHEVLAADLAYGIRDDYRGCNTELLFVACRMLIEDNQAEIVQALRESLADD